MAHQWVAALAREKLVDAAESSASLERELAALRRELHEVQAARTSAHEKHALEMEVRI